MTFRFLRCLRRRIVSRSKLRDTELHRVLGDRLFSKNLWAFRRDAVARDSFISAGVGVTGYTLLRLPWSERNSPAIRGDTI